MPQESFMIADHIQQFLSSLSILDYAVILLNILLIAFAKPIVSRISSTALAEKTLSSRAHMLRGLNVVILLVYVYQYFYLPYSGSGAGGGLKILSILAILYVANI